MNIAEMTLSELRDKAKDLGLKGVTKYRKAQLIEYIEQNNTTTEEETVNKPVKVLEEIKQETIKQETIKQEQPKQSKDFIQQEIKVEQPIQALKPKKEGQYRQDKHHN